MRLVSWRHEIVQDVVHKFHRPLHTALTMMAIYQRAQCAMLSCIKSDETTDSWQWFLPCWSIPFIHVGSQFARDFERHMLQNAFHLPKQDAISKAMPWGIYLRMAYPRKAPGGREDIDDIDWSKSCTQDLPSLVITVSHINFGNVPFCICMLYTDASSKHI